jgi:probable HAF family extracellular repeat protein
MPFRKAVLSLAVLLLASVPLALAQGTYTQIDEPNAVGQTYCYGIDTAGDIVGYYVDASRVGHGFLLSGGTYTTIDYPGSSGTLVTGMNDNGQIVGFTGSTPTVGFLYDLTSQTFTTIRHPHAFQTFPYAINNAGTIAGYYQPHQDLGVTSGFVVSKANYKTINPAGTQSSTYLTGISSSTELTGYISTIARGFQSFLYSNGKYRDAQIPNAPSAVVYGINPTGSALVGYYHPSSNVTAGFLYESNTLQELQFPGGTETVAYGVSSSGEVVGFFIESNGVVHGFTWTPPADAGKK